MTLLAIYFLGAALFCSMLIVDIRLVKGIKIRTKGQFAALLGLTSLWPITFWAILVIWLEYLNKEYP